ncbi:hypothetical protein [Phenylobacterium soli]|uniref:Uncharacterized protein n=1 Tax=Phenylobacterium soli TaxID=2170551 RepID=A0A328ABL0_9CAUL|nr:hypothetical protein [Phenylobacterium soli]RAK51606.1 hypothetical protein DJ017_17370 [Phenylobacterium soli]
MNALTTSSPAAKPTTLAPSPHLSALLDRDGNPDDACQEIASYLALREECREILPALREQAERRADQEGIRAVVGRRFATYPQPERNEGEWAAWWRDYYDALTGLSLASLEAAMREWIKRSDSQFLPKPGELRELALRTPSRALQRYQRARRVVELSSQTQQRERVQADMARRGTNAEEQRRAVADMARGLAGTLSEEAAKQKGAMRRQTLTHASRCVRPEGDLTPAQADVLRRCGIE